MPMTDNADLWGINPQTGGLYTVQERRQGLKDRGVLSGVSAGLDDPSWDRWFDAVNNAAYAQTGKTPAQLKIGFAGGPSAPGSSQLRGQSVQPRTSISGGYPVAGVPRPSMQALGGYGEPQRYGFNQLTNDEVNNREFAPTFEQQRQGQMLMDMDARANASIAADMARDREAFDINTGGPMARAQAQGDAQRSQASQNARSAAWSYFDPAVTRMRESQNADQLEQFNARYNNPAVTRAQAMIDAANARGAWGVAREQTAGGFGLLKQDSINQTNAQGNVNDNNARLGSAASAANPRTDLAPFAPQLPGPPRDPNKTITAQELAAYAQQSGMSLQDAYAEAEQGGYSITR